MPNVLAVIADNPALIEALKELLEAEFTIDEGRTDDAISDIQLGQMYRARLVGLQKIKEAFRKIAKHKTLKEPGKNVARHR